MPRPVAGIGEPRRPDARFDLADDLPGLLRTRVVGGYDGQIAVGGCGLTHERPLSPVPVAPAAEDGDDSPRAKRGQVLQDPSEGVIRVGIINKNGGLPRRTDLLQATRDMGQGRDPVADGPSGDAEFMSCSGGGQDIGEVELPDERGGNGESLPPSLSSASTPPSRQLKRGGGDVAGRVDAVRKAAEPDLAEDAPAPGIVDIDDHLPGAAFRTGGEHLGKEAPLRLEVVLHRLVVIEVVLGKVGEDPQVECAVVDPLEVDGVRRNLHRHMRDPEIGHLPDDPLQLERFRGRIRRGKCLAPVAVVYRTQDADGMAGGPEDRFDQVGDGGLAVGPDDGDEADPG